MKKKYLSILLVLILTLLALLTACSNQSKNEKQSQGNTDTSTDQPASKDRMTLNFWSEDGDKLVDNAYAVKAVEDRFQVNINLVGQNPDTYKEQLLLDITSGKIPDQIRDQSFPDYDKFIQQGILAEIPDGLVKSNAPHYYNWIVKYLGEDPYAYFRRDGKNYSLPIIWTPGSNGLVVGMREDWLKNVGIPKPPETLKEFEDALFKFRNDDPDQNGKKDTYGMTASAEKITDIFSSVFATFGVYPGTFVENNGKIVRGEIEPGAKQALTVLNQWYKEGLIDPEFVVNKSSNIDDKVISGKVGVVQNFWWEFIPQEAFYSGKYIENMPNAKWTLFAGPKGPNGDYGTTQSNPVTSSGLQFGKQLEENPEKMVKYLQLYDAFSFDEDFYAQTQYGQEGVTYEKTPEGDYKYLPPYDKEEERIKFGIGPQYADFPGSFNDYEFLTPFMTAAKYRDLRKSVENIGQGKYDILQPISKPIYNEYYDRLDQFTIKNFADFITGNKPLDQFEDYVNQWTKMGGDKVMEEAQKKYKEFFKN